MFYSMTYQSPIGDCLLAADEEYLIGLWFEGQKYYCRLAEALQEDNQHPVLQRAKEWLDDYFAGKRPDLHKLPLAPIGSEFRQDVWNILKEISYGEVMTYGEIAKKIAAQRNQKTMSAQAIGGAVGNNPISVIIPCHRVVGSNGSLTGYAGGIDKKLWLLNHEGVHLSVREAEV